MRLPLLVIACLAALSPAFAGGARMSGAEIGATFRGITLDGIYDDGAFFSETYFEDGTIRYHDVDGADSGEWSVEGDTFCTFYEGQTGACFFVEREGDNCFTFFEAVEGGTDRLAPAEAWTSRGWNRDADPTCETPPGAEI